MGQTFDVTFRRKPIKYFRFFLVLVAILTGLAPLFLKEAATVASTSPWSIRLENFTQRFDDRAAFAPQVELLPLPNSTDSNVVVLILSARNHFDRRQAIRETWAKGHDNVYFVIGSACLIPIKHRIHSFACHSRPLGPTKRTQAGLDRKQHQDLLQKENEDLVTEHELYRDIIVTPKPESYRSLPNKLKFAYDFVVQHCFNAQWIVKADDDFYVRVEALPAFLEPLNASLPTVVGKILWWGDHVARTGKNAEHNYKKRKYPNFAIGSYGHVVSRPVAEYVAQRKHELFEYQGEDTSLGIWLDESTLDPIWVKAGDYKMEHQQLWHRALQRGLIQFKWEEVPVRLSRNGNCTDTNLIVIGHNIDVPSMRKCFAAE